MSESCKDILNLIPMYIDAILDTEESDRVAEHINSCEKCRAEFMLMASVMKKTKELPDIKISADFHNNLMQKIRKQQAENRKKRIILLRRSGAGVAAAAVVALSVVSFGGLKNSPTDIDIESPVISNKSTPEADTTTTRVETTTDNNEQVKTYTNQTPKSSSPQKATPETDTLPEFSGGGSSAAAAPTESVMTDASAPMVCDDLSCMKSVITTDDTNRDEVLEILSQYEKDEIGYVVPDINTVMKRLSELGIKVTVENCEYSSNYIIIK